MKSSSTYLLTWPNARQHEHRRKSKPQLHAPQSLASLGRDAELGPYR